ncbi:YceI family protein [Ulvibacter antarcticus]|uniref:Polyisoprenoid-binding protein YceI n=1 Tax=Ulvibacter antarcticus TaxID=442714 RepID=A0A3L9Y7W0_9FLAO|nr:YceI family protein [Ulvibacter antarcticus]RMA56793.1 polyisoprenoid-binding protein YceI [Ulvibacter antarcticus]
MKTTMKTILLAVIVMGTAAFTTIKKERKVVKEATIEWKGKKVLGSHNGTIDLTEGYLEMEGNSVTGGKFIVDMSSITVNDLEAGSGKEKLEGHLKSDDFFGVETHPQAILEITTAKKVEAGYDITGSMTIKGKTNPIEFTLAMGKDSATADLKIDRTKYGVQYGSGSFFDGLGDKAIADNFELTVNLKF